jgi:hypothetical protein
MSRPALEPVRAQAALMLNVMERNKPGALERLHVDALRELGSWSEIQVIATPEVQTDRRCSVAGGYEHRTRPPTVSVATSASRRRQQFTALHEVGHHLQNNDLDLGQGVIDADDERFEDAACDLFAARVLLPDDLVSACFGGRAPTASDVVALYQRSTASRAACCVRAVEHLDSFGTVVLYTPDGTVSFAAARGIFPPARNSDQSGTPLVAAALRHADRADGVAITADETVIAYRTGHASDRLYGQAAWCDGYVIAILVEHHAPWQPFSPPRTGTPTTRTTTSPARWATCEVCTDDFEVTEVCPTCGEPRCPSAHCRCTTAREKTCERCNLTYSRSMFPGGGTRCADCS